MRSSTFYLLTFCLLFNVTSWGRTWDEIKKSGTLKVAMDGATPGFNYYEGKKLTGFEVDIANEMANRLKLKAEWTVQPFNTLLVGLGHDRFDVIGTSFTITPERQKIVDFLTPHYCSGATIFSKKPDGPKTVAELTGKIVSVPVGTVYYQELKKNKKIKQLKTMPQETSGMQDVISGQSDAWVTEGFVGLAALKTHPELQMGERIFDQTNAMVVSKNNKKLADVLNEQLEKIKSDGTYQRLSLKYFERDIRCK